MRAEPLAVLLSSILAFGPAAPAWADPPAPLPLSARIAQARQELAGHLQGATLARADYQALQEAYQAEGAQDADAKAAWDAFEPLAHRYNALRGGLLSLDDDALSRDVRGLAKDLALPDAGADELVARYAQLKAALLENGVTTRGGAYVSHEGRPLSDAQLGALLAKTMPARPNAELRDAQIKDIQGLSDVQKALSGKDYQGAVDSLNKVLENMASRPDLTQTGFGSLPAETALAMIQKTRAALPARYRQQVKTGTIDRQLLEIANKKIDVPEATSRELPRARQEQSPFRTGVELSFYASLTGFPLVSHWAEKKLYAAQGTSLLAQDKSVGTFRYAEKDPEGRAKPGFYVTYKDGSKRYESRDGESVVTSKDGATVIEQNPGAGTFRQTVKGEEVLAYARGKDGVLRGKFRGRPFEADKREQVILSPDQQTLYVIEGFTKEGPNVKSWLGPDGERGRVLAGGLGTVVVHKDNGRVVKDIFLEPEALKKAVAGPLDLSAIGNDLDEARRRKFGQVLHDLGSLGSLFKAAFGEETIRNANGSSAIHGVEGAYIRDGRLTIGLTEQFNQPGKPGKAHAGFQIAVDLDSDGSLKAFLFKGDTVLLWKFDPSMNQCDQFTRDAEAQMQGKTEFALRSRFQRTGDGWTRTENHPIELKEWSWTDGLKAGASGALDAVGTVGEVAFSPFQTAHHYLHSGLVSAMGHGYGAVAGDSDIGAWSDIDGVYSRRQATFNKWAGAGLDTQQQRDTAYRSALDSAGTDQRRREFNNLLDSKVEEQRRAAYGELWRFHQNDPVTAQDRANAASTMFGLSNLANNYSQMADEQFARGNTAAGVGLKGVKYFVIGGEMYVQGAGFGAAANGLKTLAVGARYGLSAEQVANAAQRAALIERGAEGVAALTKTERLAVGSLKWIGRAETATFLAPAGAQMGGSLLGGAQALYRHDTKTALGHLDNFLSGAAALVLPLGLNAGEKAVNDAVVKVSQMRATSPDSVRVGQDSLLADLRKDKPQAADQAQRVLTTDSMTQMNNRSWIERNADAMLGKLQKPTVSIMDMNNFGAVNDGLIKLFGPSRGKAMADGILFKSAFRLKGLAEAHNVQIARFGGEEFAVIGEQADVLRFTEAVKLEFKGGQPLTDAGFGPESAEYKAMKEAAVRKGRGDQTMGDFTFGVAGAQGRSFSDAWHAADLALGAAKKAPGGRGNAFVEQPGQNGAVSYSAADLRLDDAALARQHAERAARDGAIGTASAPDIVADLDDLKGKLGEEGYARFQKVANVDSLTQTREYDYVRAQAPEWDRKYAQKGEAVLMSARGLKLINDALGHEAGDRYLKALGRELRSIVLDQRAKGNWLEDPSRIASKDFLVVGRDAQVVSGLMQRAMARVMAGTEVLSKADRAKMAEHAKGTADDPALAGTLRVVDTPMLHKADRSADVFATLDHLIDLSDAAKQKEQPAPAPPPQVHTHH